MRTVLYLGVRPHTISLAYSGMSAGNGITQEVFVSAHDVGFHGCSSSIIVKKLEVTAGFPAFWLLQYSDSRVNDVP